MNLHIIYINCYPNINDLIGLKIFSCVLFKNHVLQLCNNKVNSIVKSNVSRVIFQEKKFHGESLCNKPAVLAATYLLPPWSAICTDLFKIS